MTDKIKQSVSKTKHRMQSADEILTAASITAVEGFAGIQAYTHRGENIGYALLAGAVVYGLFQAVRAWNKVLDKK